MVESLGETDSRTPTANHLAIIKPSTIAGPGDYNLKLDVSAGTYKGFALMLVRAGAMSFENFLLSSGIAFVAWLFAGTAWFIAVSVRMSAICSELRGRKCTFLRTKDMGIGKH